MQIWDSLILYSFIVMSEFALAIYSFRCLVFTLPKHPRTTSPRLISSGSGLAQSTAFGSRPYL